MSQIAPSASYIITEWYQGSIGRYFLNKLQKQYLVNLIKNYVSQIVEQWNDSLDIAVEEYVEFNIAIMKVGFDKIISVL